MQSFRAFQDFVLTIVMFLSDTSSVSKHLEYTAIEVERSTMTFKDAITLENEGHCSVRSYMLVKSPVRF